MENTVWHILAPKWSPWDYVCPRVIKLVLMVPSCSMFLTFGTWIWKWEEQSWVHHFPDTMHQRSRKYLKCPDGSELLKHRDGTAALPNSILFPEKTMVGFSGDQTLIVAAQQCLVYLQRAQMVFAPHHTTVDSNRLKVKAKEWWLSSLRQITYPEWTIHEF